nr:ATP-binding protein [Thermoflexibacter sp.]
IIGFTQSRGTVKLGEQPKQRNAVQLPEISDLIPLINNDGDNRLQLFSSWIINLDAEANKRELQALKEGKENFISQERQIITKVFDIFSKITQEEVKFKEVLNNNDVWITTQNNPLGISIDLVSQGFQSVIGWIGYLLQRMAEAYSDSKDFTKEPAICFVDEIDTYLHPKWQRNILKVLKEEFVQTQFIITTHSPLVISNLKNEEVNIFKVNKNSVHKIPAYGKNLHSIYLEAFEVPERAEEVQKLLNSLSIEIERENVEKAENLLDTLKSMILGNDPELLGYETSIDLLKNEHEIYQEEQ